MEAANVGYSIKAIAVLLLLGLIWGSGYSLAHYATTHGVNPLGYAFWQSLGPAILLTLFCSVKISPPSVKRQYIIFYIISGLVGIAIPNTNMYFAAAHIPAGILAVVVNTVPVVTYFLALILREEEFSLWRLRGVFFCVLGLMFLVLPGLGHHGKTTTMWVLIALISPICFACCAVYGARFRPAGSHSATLAAGMLVVSAIFLTPVVLATDSFYSFEWPFQTRDWVILIEILLSSVGYILFFYLLKFAGAVYYSLVAGIVALTGLGWGWILFDERFHSFTYAAILLIVVGVLIVSCVRRRKA